MPGIGKNTRRLVAYVQKETEAAIKAQAEQEKTSTGKILDGHFGKEVVTPEKAEREGM